MELRQAEALGVFDEHDIRIRDVDSDFDNGRGDKRGQLAGVKFCDGLFLFLGRHPSMKQPNGVRRQGSLPFLKFRCRGFHEKFLGLLHQRIHDIGLAPELQLLADELNHFGNFPDSLMAVSTVPRLAGFSRRVETSRSP